MSAPISPATAHEGHLYLFDHTGATQLFARLQVRCVVPDTFDFGTQQVTPKTTSYVEGGFYVRDARPGERGAHGEMLGAGRFLAPAKIHAERRPGVPTVKNPYPIIGSTEVRQTRNLDLDDDLRLEPIGLADVPPLFPFCGSPIRSTTSQEGERNPVDNAGRTVSVGAPMPGSTRGLLVRATEEGSQHLLFHPSWQGVLIADHRNRDINSEPHQFSTRLVDVIRGDISKDYIAGLHTGLRVEGSWDKHCGVALFWGVDQKEPDVGRGLFTSSGPFGAESVTVTLGYAGESGGGPIGAGAGRLDKHYVGASKEGRAINQGHLYLEAPWYLDRTRDAPPEIDLIPYQKNRQGGVWWRVACRYNPALGHRILGEGAKGDGAEGRFSWQAKVPLYIPDPEDDEDPPKPPPPPPPFPPRQPLPPLEGSEVNPGGGAGGQIPPRPPLPPLEGSGVRPFTPEPSTPPTLPPLEGGPVEGAQTGELPPLDPKLQPRALTPEEEAALELGATLEAGAEPTEAGAPLAGSGARADLELDNEPEDGDAEAALTSNYADTGGFRVEPGKRPEDEDRPCRIRSVLHSWMELGVSAGAFRASHSRGDDLRYVREPSLEAAARHIDEAPIVGRFDVVAAEVGNAFDLIDEEDCPRYDARSPTAGGVIVGPPQFGSERLRDEFAQGADYPSELSEFFWMHATTKARVGWGELFREDGQQNGMQGRPRYAFTMWRDSGQILKTAYHDSSGNESTLFSLYSTGAAIFSSTVRATAFHVNGGGLAIVKADNLTTSRTHQLPDESGTLPAREAMTAWFGDASDGNATISGTTNLERDYFYDTLTIESTGVLDTKGFRVYARSLVMESGGAIQNAGAAASGKTEGAGATSGTLGGGKAGGSGGSGGSGGTAGTDANPGLGGAGGDASSGGVTGGAVTQPAERPRALPQAAQLRDSSGTAYAGGAGGAGGDDAGASDGGGGGGGGGVIYLAARTIEAEAGAIIDASGGAGGTGGATADGGGGGGGGVVIAVYQTESGLSAAVDVSGGTAGAATAGGAPGSAGADGELIELRTA